MTVIIYGLVQHDLAWSLGGACLTMPVLTLIALVAVRRWIVDTRDERRVLAAAQRQAEVERTRYIAAQAALENEQGRVRRDVAAERSALAAQTSAERAAMEAEFEEKRAALICKTMEATVRMFHEGKFAPQPSATTNLIPFPDKPVTRERPRGHGVVGP
ncbi:hypothetical protein AB0M23_05010 [Streptomyces sp. NPDC052077]|uniref:hypothetical protein n=1 Tax=Streptomyces sp. NPDC052077 TaxID=3154757 RepID=UPI00343AC4E4